MYMSQNLSFEKESNSIRDTTSKKVVLSLIEDEGKLWADFKKGDESAFTSLYNKYIVQLYNYGERLTADKASIEDSIHDFFVELWKKRVTISQVYSVKVYLYKGFKNRLIKNLDKKRRFPCNNISEDYQFEIVFSPEFDLIAEQVSKDQKEELLQTVNQLAPRQKEALTLRFFDELSYKQIAFLMKIPVKSVYMLIYRAIDFLKQHLSKNIYFMFITYFLKSLHSI